MKVPRGPEIVCVVAAVSLSVFSETIPISVPSEKKYVAILSSSIKEGEATLALPGLTIEPNRLSTSTIYCVSTKSASIVNAGVMSDVPLPNEIELRSDLERTIWHQFSRARAREDWCYMDLIWLAKILRMEANIRTAQTELDDVGMIVENKRGTPIPNPLLSVINTLERRQLAVIRSMSLNQTASDP